jgi:hypothetical protein
MSGTRWCSYRELAEAWNVAPPAAKARVRRAGWRRQTGNDGAVRIEVPVEALTPVAATSPPTLPATEEATSPPTLAPASPLDSPAVAVFVAELREERDRARSETAELREKMVMLRERIARLEGEAAGMRATAIADVATARAEVEAMQKIVTLLEGQLREARRPWWRRWWGQP